MRLATLLSCLLVSTSLLAQVPSYVPTDNLRGWWDFNGQMNDQSGSSMTFSPYGGTFLGTDRFGVSGSAVQLTGNGSASAPNDGTIPQYAAMTISYWVHYQGGETSAIVALGASSGQSWSSYLGSTGGINYADGCGDNGGSGGVGGTEAYHNAWHHVVMTTAGVGQAFSVYVDGNLHGSSQGETGGGCNSSSLHLGVDIWGAPEYMIGSIDDFGIWGRILSSTEIQALYAGEADGCTNPNACNYNPGATEDDGTCISPCIEGCTDSGACNYNAEANSDNGSCLFLDLATSFQDDLCAGDEFEVSAQFSISPGSTEWTVIGNQTQSFGSAWSINWNLIEGHTYRLQVSGTYRIWSQGCVDFEHWCDHNHGGYPGLPHSGCPPNITHSLGCSVEPDSDVFNSTDHTYEYTFIASSSSLTIEFTDCCYNDNAGALNFQLLEPDFNPNASDVIWSNGNTGLSASYALMEQGWASVTYSSDLGVCADSVLVDVLTVGCLDPSACNFDSNAGCDSGLCTYPGCADSEACNFNAEAGCDDGSCVYPPLVELGANTTLCDGQTLDLSVDAPGLTTTWSTGATGSNLTVTESGTYTAESGGEYGADYRLEFDGVDDYVSFGSSLDITTYPFSIQADIKVPSDYWAIMETDDGTDGYSGIWFEISSNTIELSVGEGSGASSGNRRSKIANHTLTSGDIINIAGIIRGATDMSIYVDGIDMGGTFSGSGNTTFIDNGFDAVIGRHTPSSGPSANQIQYNDGSVDNLHVWTKALTTEEVVQYAEAPATGDENGLLAVYTFDEGAGNTAVDDAQGFEASLFGDLTWVLKEAGCSASDTITVNFIDCESLCGPGTTWDPILQSCVADTPDAAAAENCSLFTLQELSSGYLLQQGQLDLQDTLIIGLQQQVDSLNALLNNCPGND